MGAWFLGNVIAGFVGGIVSYAIGHIESIAPWKVFKFSNHLARSIVLTS